MSKIYVVTLGCYSDYHICGVATDKEKANLLAKKFSTRYDTAEVEEYDTDDTDEHLRFRNVYLCRYIDDTKKIETTKSVWAYLTESDYRVTKTRDGLLVYVNADTEEMALKKASDIFAQYRAERLTI